jgi:hypothetical protein
MTDIAATKARLLAKHIGKAIEEHDRRNEIDLTPILEYLNDRVAYVSGIVPDNILTTRDMKNAIQSLEQKEHLERLIKHVDAYQNPKRPGPSMDIHILSIYLFPELYEYALKYEPTNDCRVSPMYDAIGKVLCKWSGHTYYGND